jgi:light-regulated signal transduction histidine kinase (bacteriophytochrome)
MRELLADLLAYTQLTGSGQETEKPIDLNHVFGMVLENCKATIDESNAVITSDPLPTIFGQEPHFIQLFQNLIGNALKYRSNLPPQVHVSAQNQNELWRLAVADNGIGIDPEYHQQIFGVFKRLHGKTISGTGIGLAICQRVVQRHGGRIWVESKVGQGATFYFTFPAAQVAAAHES